MSPRGDMSRLFGWRTAISCPEAGLTANEHHVGVTLSLHMNELGSSCYPGVELLAEETGLAPSTVREALNQLVALGWIDRRRRIGRGNANQYEARLPDWYETHRAAAVFDDPVRVRREAALAAATEAHSPSSEGPGEPAADPENHRSPAGFPAGERDGKTAAAPSENHRDSALKPPGPGAEDDKRGPGGRQTREPDGSLVPAEAGERDSMIMEVGLALSAALGVRVAGLTRSERGAWERAVRDLVDVDATAAQVGARCAAYRARWPEMALTPMALVRHWGLLGAKVEGDSPLVKAEAWVETTARLLGAEIAHELLDERDSLTPVERVRLHQRIDEVCNPAGEAAA